MPLFIGEIAEVVLIGGIILLLIAGLLFDTSSEFSCSTYECVPNPVMLLVIPGLILVLLSGVGTSLYFRDAPWRLKPSPETSLGVGNHKLQIEVSSLALLAAGLSSTTYAIFNPSRAGACSLLAEYCPATQLNVAPYVLGVVLMVSSAVLVLFTILADGS